MNNLVACLVLSLFIATALSYPQGVALNGFTRLCCNFDPFCQDGNQHWYLYVPGDVQFSCEDIIQNTNRNDFYGDTLNSPGSTVHPDFSGYAWELNGCHLDNGNGCTNGPFDNWCDDDDEGGGPICFGNDDDDGLGANTWMRVWQDASPLARHPDEQCPYQFTITRTWTSQSTCISAGGPISDVQLIYVVDQVAPNLEIPADLTIECPTNFVPDYTLGQADAVDQCTTTSVSYTSSLTRSGPPACNAGTLTRIFTARDRCGNSAEATQTVTIVDTTPPIIPQLPTVTTTCTETDRTITGDPGTVSYYECEQFIPAGPTYLDFPDNDCSITIDQTFGCDRIAAGTDRTFVLTVPAGELITLEFNDIRTEFRGLLRVYDGPSSASPLLITIDTPSPPSTPPTPPVAAGPGPITGSSNQLFVLYDAKVDGDPTIIDGFSGFFYGRKSAPDGSSVASIVSEEIIPGPCEGTYTLLRTWGATDECLNQGTMTQTIFVVDNVPPSITPAFPPQTNIVEQIECLADFQDFNYAPLDDCSATGATITKQVSLVGASGQNFAFGIAQTFTATDGCDNTITWTYTQEIGYYPVYISGVLPPSISGALKGTPFGLSIGVAEIANALNYLAGNTNPTFCTSPVVVVVDAGPALLSTAGSDPCWTQAAGGLLYCQTTSVDTPTTVYINLSLTVPLDYAPSSLIISVTVAERSIVDISWVPLLFGGTTTDNVIVTFSN